MAESSINILCCPWRSFSENLLVKADFSPQVCLVLICDLKKIWKEELTEAETIAKIQRLNPTVSATNETLLRRLSEIVLGESPAEYVVKWSSCEDERLDITYKSQLSRRTFSWEFNGTLCSSTEFANHFSQPLILMVAESLRRERELWALLKRKDLEIDDYKHAGAALTRKNLETPVFDEKEWLKEQFRQSSSSGSVKKSADNICGSLGHPAAVELYQSVMESWKRPPTKDQTATPINEDSQPKKLVKTDSQVKRDEQERRATLKRQLEEEKNEKKKKVKGKGKLRGL